MKALCWHGTGDVRVDNVPDPKIEDPRDAIIKITASGICGSDLHLFDGFMPTMETGDILGHEPMGEVVEVGSGVTNLKKGDRVVVPFTIACGSCFFCKKTAVLAAATTRTRTPRSPARRWAIRPRACSASRTCSAASPAARRSTCACPSPTSARSRSSRTCPTRRCCSSPTSSRPATWPPRTADIEPGDTVAVWGCGPVGQFAIQSAWMLGAGRVIAIDRVPERLADGRDSTARPRRSTSTKQNVYDTLRR